MALVPLGAAGAQLVRDLLLLASPENPARAYRVVSADIEFPFAADAGDPAQDVLLANGPERLSALEALRELERLQRRGGVDAASLQAANEARRAKVRIELTF